MLNKTQLTLSISRLCSEYWMGYTHLVRSKVWTNFWYIVTFYIIYSFWSKLLPLVVMPYRSNSSTFGPVVCSTYLLLLPPNSITLLDCVCPTSVTLLDWFGTTSVTILDCVCPTSVTMLDCYLQGGGSMTVCRRFASIKSARNKTQRSTDATAQT